MTKPLYLNDEIIEMAENGDSFAQLDIGKSYFCVYLLNDNCSLAFKWISLSAQQGNMEAQFRLGDLYALGQGTEQSHTRAYEWYTKSALQGYSKALIRIHNLYEDDKFLHCKGSQNEKEAEYPNFHLKYLEYREISEYRLKQYTLIQNRAIEYYQQLFDTFSQKEKINNIHAQLYLGFMYQHGYGTRKNIKRAIECYIAAAEEGVTEAQLNIGEIYRDKQSIKYSSQNALKWFSKAAENGNPVAQSNLAYIYEKGTGVENNYSKALHWYTKAASMRYHIAQFSIARMYRIGLGVPQDYKKSIEWYNLAAIGGSRAAQNCLDQLHSQEQMNFMGGNDSGLKYYKNPAEGRRIKSLLRKHVSDIKDINKEKQLKKLAMNAMRDDIFAMYEIGMKYRDGIDLPLESDLSLRWINKSARGGLEAAQFTMGNLYKEGELVEQNYHRASIWYKKGVSKKNDIIQYNLGMMFYMGYGVRHDQLEASKWFFKSAEKNNNDSQYQIGHMKLYGICLRQDTSEAYKWFMRAVRQKNHEAMYGVASIYLYDKWTKKDLQKGVTWLRHAANYGNDEAADDILRDDAKRKVLVDWKLLKIFSTGSKKEGSNNLNNLLSLHHLDGEILEKDYIKAFHFIKKSRGKAVNFDYDLLSTPVEADDGLNCSALLDMYKYISRRGIANFEYNIGYAYEFGIKHVDNQKTLLEIDISKAIEWYNEASLKLDPRAEYRLGVIYATGKTVEKNISMAASFYTQAVEKQNCDAMYRLACLYLRGEIVPQDLVKAFQLFTESHNIGQRYSYLFLKQHKISQHSRITYMTVKTLFTSDEDDENGLEYYSDEKESNTLALKMLETVANLGNVAVQYRLGCLYGDTETDDTDNSKAAYWFNLASQGGITDAYYRLGTLYEKGQGVAKDYSQALKLYKKAAEKKHDRALYRLAKNYHYGSGAPVDLSKAFILYQESAAQQNKVAQDVIRLIKFPYESSSQGPKEQASNLTISEIENILSMYEFIANKGDTRLQFQLGYYYENNQFGSDYTKAGQWYSIARECGHVDAIYRLGRLYEQGLGVIQDYKYAIDLYNVAKEGGSNEAIYSLGNMYRNGLGVVTDYKKAFSYYSEASEQGNTDAQFKLGMMYDQEALESKNVLKALEWYTISYLQGNDNAREPLYMLYEDEERYENFFYSKLAKILLSYAKEKDYHLEKYIVSSSTIYSRLYHVYIKGEGIQKNSDMAWHYLRMAIVLELTSSLNNLKHSTSRIIKENTTDIYEKALEESEKNDKWAHILLGLIHLGGITLLEENGKKTYSSVFEDVFDLNGNSFHHENKSAVIVIIPKDHKKALEYFLKAAKTGDSYSTLMVGRMHQCGYGVKQDFIKAYNYYQRISEDEFYHHYEAEQFISLLYAFGDKEIKNDTKSSNPYRFGRVFHYSDFNKAQLYYYGHGLSQNYKAALEIFLCISSWKHGNNLCLIVKMNESRLNEQPDINNRIYSIVSEMVLYGETEYLIGIMYEKGQGAIVNYKESFQRFSKAKEYGNKKAENHLNLYYIDGKFIK